MAKKSKPSLPLLKIVGVVVGLVVLGIIVYSVWFTLNAGAETKGVITCTDSDTCFWTAHFHVLIPIDVCGEPLKLPIEVGSLQKAHTHEEPNIMHWHDRLPYDNKAKKIVDTSNLKLGSFFNEIKVPFSSTQIDEKKNGEDCGDGKPATLKMLVNGKSSTLFEEYEMHDKDVVWLVFDSRSNEEIENAWKANPIPFVSSGNG